MNRRSFIKGFTGLLGLSYLSPGSLFGGAGGTKTIVWETEMFPLDSFADMYIKPAMQALADQVDRDIMNLLSEA